MFRDSLGLVRGHLLGKKKRHVLSDMAGARPDLRTAPLLESAIFPGFGIWGVVMLHGMFVRCRPVTENLTRETSAIARYGARLTSFILFLARTLGNPLYGRDDLRIREVFVPLPT